MLSDTYHEIYGLYFEGGEERTKNIEVEVAALEAELQEARDCSIQNATDCHAAEAQVARLTEALMKIMLGFLSSKEMRYVAKEALDA